MRIFILLCIWNKTNKQITNKRITNKRIPIKTMNKSILIVILLFSFLANAQEVDKDSLKTEEVNIVKPYTPKIKDAFKIKKNPVLGNDEINDRKTVEYTIHSVPVASTFTPSKGRAKGVSQKKRERLYENYASVGFGNYTTPKIEFFGHTSTTRDNDIGVKLDFHSSNGGIKDVALDNDFMDGKIDAYYKNSIDALDWKFGVGYHYKKQNWYGLTKTNTLTDAQLNAINSKQVYNGFNLGGEVIYYDATFKGIDLDANLFTDAYNSSEFHILATPKFEFPISSEWIDTDVRLEYIGGSFEKNYAATNTMEYGFYNLGIRPNFKVNRDFLSINLGADLVYTADIKNNGINKFFIYPNVTASYELIQDIVTVYAGVTGGLQQHSYQEFVLKNEFVSPTLNIARTNEQYNAKIGTKGKIASNVSFNINASYKSENAKPLFKLNEDLSTATPNNYQYANSFQVVYDNVKTFGVFGELTMDFTKEIRFGGNASLNTYNLEIQKEAWNLPNLEASVFANYDAKKVIVGAKLFFVSDRKDEYINNTLFVPVAETITNKSYVDLNVNLGYRFTNKLSAFINGNNLFGSNYQKFTNYKVQGIQVLGGIKYKFDL